MRLCTTLSRSCCLLDSFIPPQALRGSPSASWADGIGAVGPPMPLWPLLIACHGFLADLEVLLAERRIVSSKAAQKRHQSGHAPITSRQPSIGSMTPVTQRASSLARTVPCASRRGHNTKLGRVGSPAWSERRKSSWGNCVRRRNRGLRLPKLPFSMFTYGDLLA